MDVKVIGVIAVLCLAAALFCAFFIPGVYVSNSAVVKAVAKQGYSNPVVTSSHVLFVSWRGCSGSDDAAYGMVATNSNGQVVELIACAGWPFKGVTVRTK
jgi:hypothetical protein